MVAALKSYVPRPRPDRLNSAASPRRPLRAPLSPRSVAAQQQASMGQLRPLPATTPASPLLGTLTRLQVVASVVTTVLVGLSLVSYGASVFVDRQLHGATRQLSQLQRSEQQLTTANALLTSHIAKQAEQPDTGLQPPKPDSVIFLKPAPARLPTTPTAVVPSLNWFNPGGPLGY
ncbi:MAG TPA: hypothetical protein IGR64_05580 [Leptolyngbyaceae cyanobacterium M65_K2018_010]|nr:hypothetical protein [Leptolyngbyaceae cyanobacterium M65_K2018_010]